jgi:hypothetical protein
MTPNDGLHVVGPPVVPSCWKCGNANVLGVEVSGVSPEVHYWRCDACGLVWATRDGEELRTIASDQSPRRSA